MARGHLSLLAQRADAARISSTKAGLRRWHQVSLPHTAANPTAQGQMYFGCALCQFGQHDSNAGLMHELPVSRVVEGLVFRMRGAYRWP